MPLPLTAWPKHRVDLVCTGKTPRAAGPRTTPERKRVFDAGFYGRPAIGPARVIYVCYAGDRLRAIRTTDWQILWTYDPEPISVDSWEPTIREDGVIYIAANEHVLAVHPDGTLKWSFWANQYTQVAGSIAGPTISADGTRVYAASADAVLIAIDADAGTEVWTNRDVVGASGTSPPAVGPDGTIYWMVGGRRIIAVNPDRTTKWIHDAGISGPNRTPIAGSNAVYAVFGTSMRAVRLADGGLVWKYQLPTLNNSIPSLDEANQAVYVGTQGGTSPETLYALDLAGNTKWTRSIPGVNLQGPAVDKNGNVYVTTRGTARVMAAFDPAGTELWTLSLPVNGHDPVIDETGDIYLGTDSSGLQVFGVRKVPVHRPQRLNPMVLGTVLQD